MKSLSVAIAAVALLAVACGGDDAGDSAADRPTVTTAVRDADGGSTTAPDAPDEPDEDPEDAFLRQLDYLSKGQYGREWDELHPAQQKFVDRNLYISCASDRLDGIEIVDADIVEVYDEKSDVPGSDLGDVDSKAITAKIKVSFGGQTSESTDTYHEFLVDGRWVWTVDDAEPYKNGECPE